MSIGSVSVLAGDSAVPFARTGASMEPTTAAVVPFRLREDRAWAAGKFVGAVAAFGVMAERE
jgi:hypothetical protein